MSPKDDVLAELGQLRRCSSSRPQNSVRRTVCSIRTAAGIERAAYLNVLRPEIEAALKAQVEVLSELYNELKTRTDMGDF